MHIVRRGIARWWELAIANRFQLGRKWVFALATIVFAAVAIRAWWPKPNLADDAESIGWALLQGDSELLADHLYDGELKLLGWNRQHAKLFIADVIVPRFRKVASSRVVSKEVANNGTIGIATFELRGDDGQPVRVGFTTVPSDTGSVIALKHLLFQAWIVDSYCTDQTVRDRKDFRLFAVKAGIVSDFEKLRRWGFRGFLRKLGGSQINPVDKAYQGARDYLKGNASSQTSAAR